MLSLRIASRFLRKSPVQSVLIVLGIAVGIGVQVFVGSLITSLQGSLLDSTVGSSPHLTVLAEDEGDPIVFDAEAEDALDADERITAIVPERSLNVLFVEGADSAPLAVKGGDPDALDSIYGLSDSIVEGDVDLGEEDLLVGVVFAEEYGLAPGDVVEVLLPDGMPESRTIAGVFDLGQSAVNTTRAFSTAAFPGEVLGLADDEFTSVELQVDDVFASTEIAEALGADLPDATIVDWQEENADLLQALQSQGTSSYMIQVFVVIAVALGIASTLAISAVQKTRQIGILKALGMRDRATGTVFLWQGLLLGALGTAAGIGLALGLIGIFTWVSANAETALFEIVPEPAFVAFSAGIGIGIAMLSAAIPYRRTARLDPIEVIQSG